MSTPAVSLRSSRHQLRARLAEARAVTDAIFPLLRDDALYDRPIAERHRLIFYLGHLEAFDGNLLGRDTGRPGSQPELDKLFAFGIDPVGGGLPTDQPKDWPREHEVRAYNARVREEVDRLVDSSDGQLLHTAIEHRLMHAETLAYLLHQLPIERKIAQSVPDDIRAEVPASKAMAPIPAGAATLGQRRERGAAVRRWEFGWDNEFEESTVLVPEFHAQVYPVTNAQFLEFVRAGGYQEQGLWTDEDWRWRSGAEIEHPAFWSPSAEGWKLRTMFAEVPLPLAWPAYVSHAEASAYARWTGKHLPSEVQWHRMAYGTPAGVERAYPWGDSIPTHERGNFDFARWDASPVQAHAQGASAFGVEDLLGNGWEWTSTPFEPLPGFQAFSFYPGYSANFFDGKHFVMKGGSARTAACLLRRPFRNWFQPHYPYVYAKFRCVEN